MIRIRPVKSDDVDALYAISIATGFEGGDASHLYNDPNLMGHIYVGAYAALAPELALVVEDSEGVSGFAVGTLSTPDWEDRLERDWWPHLRLMYADPPEALRDVWSPDQRRASMIHHPTRTPSGVVDAFPSHIHLNLLPRAQGNGLGTKLFDAWRGIAAKAGVKAIHVGVNRANFRAMRFWMKIGFAELGLVDVVKGRTIWMGLCSTHR